MQTNTLTNFLSLLEPVMCALALMAIMKRGQLRPYKYLSGMLAARCVSDLIMQLPLHPAFFHRTGTQVYPIYFYTYWGSYAVEALLGMGTIVSIYRLAMAPLKGLQSLGMIMFRWAGAISVAIAVTIGFGPHVDTHRFIVRAVMQLQETQSVLTLCMLLFVCFAIHPMGLSYRSRIFGVSLGLGLVATTDLVQVAWIPHVPEMNTLFSVISSFAICVTLAIWSIYFVLPEPKRRMIVLPTTSPFFRWNQISEVLGDEPGYVALGEISSDMFAPAEVEVMRRAATKMNSAASF